MVEDSKQNFISKITGEKNPAELQIDLFVTVQDARPRINQWINARKVRSTHRSKFFKSVNHC